MKEPINLRIDKVRSDFESQSVKRAMVLYMGDREWEEYYKTLGHGTKLTGLEIVRVLKSTYLKAGL